MATARTPRKAGTSMIRKDKRERKEIAVNVRLRPEELATIDALVARRLGRPKRHSWLLEAVQEKIQREMDAEDIRAADAALLAIREGREKTYPLEEVMREHGLVD
jgi:predicted DNA-binding protein